MIGVLSVLVDQVFQNVSGRFHLPRLEGGGGGYFPPFLDLSQH